MNKKPISLIIIVLAVFSFIGNKQKPQYLDASLTIEKRVEDLLLTLPISVKETERKSYSYILEMNLVQLQDQ